MALWGWSTAFDLHDTMGLILYSTIITSRPAPLPRFPFFPAFKFLSFMAWHGRSSGTICLCISFFTCLFLWSGAPSWERQKVRYTQARAATHMLLLYLDFEHLEPVSGMCYMALSMKILITRLIVGV